MRKVIFVISFLSLLSTAEAAYLDLEWDANEEPDLAGYRVYYGTSPREYINSVDVGNVTTYRLKDLMNGVTYYVALTAFDQVGNESDFSEEVSGVSIDFVVSPEVILDDGSLGSLPTGTWKPSSGPDPYGSGSVYSNQSGATYTFEASADGVYEVSLWWTYYSNRCTDVPVDIYDGDTLLDTVYVNQKENGGQWNWLGEYIFSGTARVVINSEGGCTTNADAVRFVAAVNL